MTEPRGQMIVHHWPRNRLLRQHGLHSAIQRAFAWPATATYGSLRRTTSPWEAASQEHAVRPARTWNRTERATQPAALANELHRAPTDPSTGFTRTAPTNTDAALAARASHPVATAVHLMASVLFMRASTTSTAYRRSAPMVIRVAPPDQPTVLTGQRERAARISGSDRPTTKLHPVFDDRVVARAQHSEVVAKPRGSVQHRLPVVASDF